MGFGPMEQLNFLFALSVYPRRIEPQWGFRSLDALWVVESQNGLHFPDPPSVN